MRKTIELSIVPLVVFSCKAQAPACKAPCKAQESKNVESAEIKQTNTIPNYIQKYQLPYPQALKYEPGSKYLQKSLDSLQKIEEHYHKTFKKAGFSQVLRQSQDNKILMQFSKKDEIYSVEVSKPIYAKANTIRISYSKVDYSKRKVKTNGN